MGQRDEIKTIRARNISFNLSDADVKRLCEKAGCAGLTVSKLLENFIGDLVCGTYSNGSDERDLAQRWFARCGFSWMNGYSFLNYLIDFDDVEETVDCWNDLIYYRELKDPDEDDKEFLEELEERMSDKFEDFQGYRKVGDKEIIRTNEMEKVINWWNEYNQIKGLEVVDD